MDFGLPVRAVFASAGIAGIALALAARETLANFSGRVSILIDKPFKNGDFIILDSGERGEVKSVGMRSTRVQTRDDIQITIPNSVITNVKIVNQCAPSPPFRIWEKVDVAHSSELTTVESILIDVAKNNPLVLETPPHWHLFSHSAILTFSSNSSPGLFYPHDYGQLVHELSKTIHSRFREEGVVIPFPQRDVHLHKGKNNK